MSALPSLISDLALILTVAGCTTLLCKKLNQPSILGYILAGILIGPVVDFLPTVADTENIHIWSDIGVIFLMFALGLEFSVHKMQEVGSTGFITAFLQIIGLALCGFFCGKLMGFDTMNSIFLGGMLSMSSTMIALKAIADMGYKDKPFVNATMGTLVIEDIAAIFLMVILSTIAVSKNISGLALLQNIGMLIFYLILWLMLGIFILPSFLKRANTLMNNEMLLVFSLGICFSMAWLADALGFSTALGAFLAGSIIAGTVHAERIEELITPCKDLFGAIFFVSVGLLVEPSIILEYILPIIVLTIVTIIGKVLFLTIGMLLAGQTISDSVYAATSQTQIGEFSFIIASLGISLQVTSDFLYPVIVAVSVITTFTTPFLLRSSEGLIVLLNRIISPAQKERLEKYQTEKLLSAPYDRDWNIMLKKYASSLILYSIIVIGLNIIGIKILLPLALSLSAFHPQFIKLLATVGIYCVTMPFIPSILRFRDAYFTSLWLKSFANRIPLALLLIVRYSIAIILALLPVLMIYRFHFLLILALLPAIFFLARSDRLNGLYLQIEATFLSNFNERKLNEQYQSSDTPSHSWLDEHLFVQKYTCPDDSPIAGKTLKDQRLASILHVKVIRIVRGKKIFNIPEGYVETRAGDIIYVMAESKYLDNFRIISQNNHSFAAMNDPITLHKFIATQQDLSEENQILCCTIKVPEHSFLDGTNIKDSKIKSDLFGFLIGIERNLYPIISPPPTMILAGDDLLWLLGTQKMAHALMNQALM